MNIAVTPKASVLAQQFIEKATNKSEKTKNIMQEYFDSNFAQRVSSYVASHGAVGNMLNKLM